MYCNIFKIFITSYFDFINAKNEMHLFNVNIFIKDYINIIKNILDNEKIVICSINENIEITSNDYLLITEIYSENYMNFIFSILPKFKKENIIFFGFECQSHPCHEYKLNNGFFNKIGYSFCNYDFKKYNFSCKKYFIPTYHFIFNKYNIKEFLDNIKDATNNIKYEKFIINNPFNGYNKFRNDIIYKFKDEFNQFKFYGSDNHAKKYFKNDIDIVDENESNICKIPPYDRTLFKINKFKKYKFILIIENQNIYSYISEKLIDGIISGTLPIYYGYPDIDIALADLFDNGVINGHRYNYDELFKLIKNMTHEEWLVRTNNIKKNLNKYLILFSQKISINYMLYKVFNIKSDEYMLMLNNINNIILK
jgi:hypothetical protein